MLRGPDDKYISPWGLNSDSPCAVEPSAVEPFWPELPGAELLAPGVVDGEPFVADFAVVALVWAAICLANFSHEVVPVDA